LGDGKVETPHWKSFKSGLTPASFLALVYALVVFSPVSIYLQLMGAVGGVSAAWFTLLLWIFIGKIRGKHITKQEAFLIMILGGVSAPTGHIFEAWYRTSPQAKLYNIAQNIPDWVAPPEEVEILKLRTFLHPSWIIPISLSLITSILSGLLTWGLGLLTREMYLEWERLPFPLQKIDAELITSVTSVDERPLRFLSLSAVIGLAYGSILYALPFIFQAYLGRQITFIPIPFIDLSRSIQRFLPGASFGISTSLGSIVSGFVLPFPTVIGLFIGSMTIWVFANWLAVVYNLSPLPWWSFGMPLQMVAQRAVQYLWFGPFIGIGLAVALVPLPNMIRKVIRSFRFKSKQEVARLGERFTDPISKKLIFTFIIVGFVGLLVEWFLLVGDFFWYAPWFVPFMIISPFLTTIVSSRMIGETGVGGGFPVGTIQQFTYWFSGYPKMDIWFAPTPTNISGTGLLTTFKVAELTETKISSILKASWLLFPISTIIGYFYVQLFWSLAPIPSSRYPGTQIYWPIDATQRSLWMKGLAAVAFNPNSIPVAFLVGSCVYLAFNLLHSPIPFVAIAAGLSTIPPGPVSMLIGAILGKVLCSIFKLSEEWWNKNKTMIAAGIVLGESVASALGLSIAIIINSIWVLPV